jgi:heme/copper-type cytochrome/quinol oxidase subunit 3
VRGHPTKSICVASPENTALFRQAARFGARQHGNGAAPGEHRAEPFVSKWAGEKDLRKDRIGVIVMTAFGIAPLIPRAFEFSALNVWWDSNAYGSSVWLLLGLHTVHLITDVVDTLVLAAIMFTRHAANARRFGDVQDNALYWNFVVITWLPIYGCIYWIPRV